MGTEQLQRRRRVMQRSMALGHCICEPRQPCPCDEFKHENVCHCAGETRPASAGAVRLTQLVKNPGCASKVPKTVLHAALQGLPELSDPRVLVGAAAGDDAGVMLLAPEVASIFTVDVFAPSVDDPYTFGQIAAANSVSDIYAMGGTPQAALSIVGFPSSALPAETLRELLRGGSDKMREAGVPVIGGHTLQAAEPFCGFAVLGTARPAEIVRNAGARVGDALVLTKPLGAGIVLFAQQIGRAPAGALDAVTRSALALNRAAGERLTKFNAHAATDVTGFSLLGHMAEIVQNSRVVAEIDFSALPLFPGVRDLAAAGVLPGALERNRESVDAALLDIETLTPAQQAILFCPETSGGMLVFLPQTAAAGFVTELAAAGVEAKVVGRVTAEHPRGLIRATCQEKESTMAEPSCCAASAASESSCCTAPSQAPAGTGLPAPAANDAFRAFMAAVNAPGAIDAKHKKLMALALSVAQRCQPCVTLNAQAAREAGASEPELAEAVSLGIAFGGAPTAMFYQTIRQV